MNEVKRKVQVIVISKVINCYNLFQNGWFKLLTAEEGEFYNVPVPSEEEDLTANLKKMRVSFLTPFFVFVGVSFLGWGF
jgi:hypothetical protein